MSNSETTPVITLLGSWPVRYDREVEGMLGGTVSIRVDPSQPSFGAFPLAETGSLISAGAAVVTLGLILWDRLRPGAADEEEKPDPQELTNIVRRRGIFGVEVRNLTGGGGRDTTWTLEVRDETSGRVFQFETNADEEGLTVSFKA